MKNAKSMRWIVTLMLFGALVLSACAAQQEVVGGDSSGDAAAAEATEPAAEEAAADSDSDAAGDSGGDIIKIGALAPLSAPGTVVGGEAMRDAMMIAESDINARGGLLGKQVEVIIEDSEGLPNVERHDHQQHVGSNLPHRAA